ncbi:hypothetical protein BDF22DRAFT_671365, partial [Syncephalis plumigaleata]
RVMDQEGQRSSRLSQSHDNDSASEGEDSPLMNTSYPATHGGSPNGRHDYALPQAHGETSRPTGSGIDRLRALTSNLPDTFKSQREFLRRYIIELTAGLLVLLVIIYFLFASGGAPEPAMVVAPRISANDFAYGLEQCRRIRSAPGKMATTTTATTTTGTQYNRQRVALRNNPHYEPQTGQKSKILLHGGIVWDPVDGETHVDVLMENGVITELNSTLAGMSLEAIRAEFGDATQLEIIDVSGRIITPGIVDMHSHIGLSKWPNTAALDDVNEYTVPTLSQIRSLDGFKQSDPAIPAAVSGGVTTILALPGSALLMGGEAYAFKLRPAADGTAEGMLINHGLPSGTGWRWMKMACGENPKNVFGEQQTFPVSRMGVAWGFRERLEKARKLARLQEDWCVTAESMQGMDNVVMSERFPDDLVDESLTALIRGQVKLNVHCYEPQDLEMMLRVTKEFNIPIAAFHHALEAYLIPEVIRNSNVTIATFADLWGYKYEAFDASVNSPRILAEHGIPVALKSDHPVINSQYMMHEAAKAYQYGLSSKLALASVTSVPANALGLGDRIGRISLGYDADVVVCSVAITLYIYIYIYEHC